MRRAGRRPCWWRQNSGSPSLGRKGPPQAPEPLATRRSAISAAGSAVGPSSARSFIGDTGLCSSGRRPPAPRRDRRRRLRGDQRRRHVAPKSARSDSIASRPVVFAEPVVADDQLRAAVVRRQLARDGVVAAAAANVRRIPSSAADRTCRHARPRRRRSPARRFRAGAVARWAARRVRRRGRRPSGSSNANIEPRPTVERRSIRVPSRSDRRATMDRPSPRPRGRAVGAAAHRAPRRAARTRGTRLHAARRESRSRCPRPRCAALCAATAAADQHAASLCSGSRSRPG